MSIVVEGLDEVRDLLARAYSRSQNLEPLMDDIGEKIKIEIERSFQAQRSPFGTPWQQSQRAIATGDKTLYKSGRLHNSFTFESSVNSAKVGTNVVYAPIHNYGGQAGRNNSVTIPQRQFMPINESNQLPNYLVDDIKDLIYEHLELED